MSSFGTAEPRHQGPPVVPIAPGAVRYSDFERREPPRRHHGCNLPARYQRGYPAARENLKREGPLIQARRTAAESGAVDIETTYAV